MHTGDQPIEFKLCPEKFAHAHVLTNHQIVHYGENNHKCMFCKKKLSFTSNMRQHMRTHQEKRKMLLLNFKFILFFRIKRLFEFIFYLIMYGGYKNVKWLELPDFGY